MEPLMKNTQLQKSHATLPLRFLKMNNILKGQFEKLRLISGDSTNQNILKGK